jgi:hypothetical protein
LMESRLAESWIRPPSAWAASPSDWALPQPTSIASRELS